MCHQHHNYISIYNTFYGKNMEYVLGLTITQILMDIKINLFIVGLVIRFDSMQYFSQLFYSLLNLIGQCYQSFHIPIPGPASY